MWEGRAGSLQAPLREIPRLEGGKGQQRPVTAEQGSLPESGRPGIESQLPPPHLPLVTLTGSLSPLGTSLSSSVKQGQPVAMGDVLGFSLLLPCLLSERTPALFGLQDGRGPELGQGGRVQDCED